MERILKMKSYQEFTWIECRYDEVVVFKAAKMSESVFAGQSDILIPEIATAGLSTCTHEEDLEDVGRNVDLHIFDQNLFEVEDGW